MSDRAGRLQDKVALITGGASGIGKACATRFIAEGANVIITDINADAGSDLAARLGNQARFVQHDVTDPDAWDSAIDETLNAFGKLDILVNNAGIGGPNTIETAVSMVFGPPVISATLSCSLPARSLMLQIPLVC